MAETTIELKGSGFTLSSLHIASNDLTAIEQELSEKIQQAPKFFEMAPIVINVEQLVDADIDFVALKTMLKSLKLVPVGIDGGNAAQKTQAREAGLAIMIAAKMTQTKQDSTTIIEEGDVEIRVEKVIEQVEVPVEVPVPSYIPAKVVQQNLRSGQQVYAKDTDLVILGSVSNGAEVIADGNIHIYGALRGRAIAGAIGDNSARIYCHNIQAELVSINGTYWTSEQINQNCWQKAGCVQLENDKLTIKEIQV